MPKKAVAKRQLQKGSCKKAVANLGKVELDISHRTFWAVAKISFVKLKILDL